MFAVKNRTENIKTTRNLPYRLGIQAENTRILEEKIKWFLEYFRNSEDTTIYYSGALENKIPVNTNQILIEWVQDGVIASELETMALNIPPISLPTYAFDHQDSYPINLKNEIPKEDNWEEIYDAIVSGALAEEQFELLLKQ